MTTNQMPHNRIAQLHKFTTNISMTTIESYIHWLKNEALYFDADYQRDYVWGEPEQQRFLRTAASGFPIGNIATAKTPDWLNKEGPYIEIVDGKQRLTTLNLFISDKIPLHLDSSTVYWSELTRSEQGLFSRADLPTVNLDGAGRKELLGYFIAVNFTGVPQSKKHQSYVRELLQHEESRAGSADSAPLE